jgi:hypothetical protein
MAKGLKTGGRSAGTENHTTKEVRKVLKDIIDKELVNIGDLLNELQSKERLEFIVKLLPYVLPKLALEQIEQPKEEIKQFEVVVVDNNNKHLYLNKSEID